MPIVLGAEDVAGFVFLNSSDTVTTPGAVTVKVTAPDGTVTTWTAADSEVSLGAVLPAAVQTRIVNQSQGKVAAADIAAGVGCVSVTHTPNAVGDWWVSCEATSLVSGAERAHTHVLPVAGG